MELQLSVDIKIGETAISGTTNIAGSNLITIADPASILVEVQVDEADIANVRLDQDVDVYAVAFPDDALKGQVKTIAHPRLSAPAIAKALALPLKYYSKVMKI